MHCAYSRAGYIAIISDARDGGAPLGLTTPGQNSKLEIDTRANGGFIVGPGSRTPSKVTGVFDDYKIINNTSINKMPDDLREWMLDNLYRKDKSKTSSASKPHIYINNTESLYTYSFTDALLRRIFDTLPNGYWENYQEKRKRVNNARVSRCVVKNCSYLQATWEPQANLLGGGRHAMCTN